MSTETENSIRTADSNAQSRGLYLFRFLGILLSDNIVPDKRIEILKTEFGIQPDSDIVKGVRTMCNLSEGIEERGIKKGIEQIIMTMHRKGYSVDQIADITEKSIDEITAVIKSNTTEGSDEASEMNLF